MHSFIKPMFAQPTPEGWRPEPGLWVAEEKYDGHRLVVSVRGRDVRAWSRYGRERVLPQHVRLACSHLPDGTWDGELVVPGSRSYGVTVLEDADKLVFTVFDILELCERPVTELYYRERRALLRATWAEAGSEHGRALAGSEDVRSVDDVSSIAGRVWARDGEGLILKRCDRSYEPGKRVKHWLKIKKLRTAVLTVIDYVPGLMGPYATVQLRDDEGYETTVKTLNNAELARLEANPNAHLGRRLQIEYQERTPDHGYRHPRWDHWENE